MLSKDENSRGGFQRCGVLSVEPKHVLRTSSHAYPPPVLSTCASDTARTDIPEYRSVFMTFLSLLRGLNGDIDVEKLVDSAVTPWWGFIAYGSFVVVMVFVIFTMLIAIISEVSPNVYRSKENRLNSVFTVTCTASKLTRTHTVDSTSGILSVSIPPPILSHHPSSAHLLDPSTPPNPRPPPV